MRCRNYCVCLSVYIVSRPQLCNKETFYVHFVKDHKQAIQMFNVTHGDVKSVMADVVLTLTFPFLLPGCFSSKIQRNPLHK